MKHLKTLSLMIASALSFSDNPYSCNYKTVSPNYNNNIKPAIKNNIYSFNIKGIEIKAYSKKDALKRYNHLKNNQL